MISQETAKELLRIVKQMECLSVELFDSPKSFLSQITSAGPYINEVIGKAEQELTPKGD